MLEAIELVPLCFFALALLVGCAYFAYRAFPWFVGALSLVASVIVFEGFEGVLIGVFWGAVGVIFTTLIINVCKATPDLVRQSLATVSRPAGTGTPHGLILMFKEPHTIGEKPCKVCGNSVCTKLGHIV